MIIVKLMGGLGNQLFQIAYAKKIANQTKQELVIDLSYYKTYKVREFSLENLQIINEISYIEDVNIKKGELILYNITSKSYRVFQKINKIIRNTDLIGQSIFDLLSKQGYHYNFDRYYYKVDVKKKNTYIFGYFQSEKYFYEVKEELKVLFQPTACNNSEMNELLDKIKNSVSVAVSMRLGEDYTSSKGLNVCSKSYYYRAIEKINSEISDITYFVFSDDIKKAKEILKGYNCIYVEGFKDYESLILMSSCEHFIISNSSFSWWGAYLSQSVNKQIIAPNKWYSKSKRIPDIYTNDMILLEV